MTVPNFDFPGGQYLSVTSRLSLDAGGQTNMLLLRNRLFAEHVGITPTLISFDDQPDYPRIRRELIASGRVPGTTVVLNLFDWFRHEPPPLAADDAEKLAAITNLEPREEPHPDGSVHYRTYHDETGQTIAHDYLRADGSIYLRRVPDGVYLADRRDRVVRRFGSVAVLRRWWITRLLYPEEQVFIISDSRFATKNLIPLVLKEPVRLIHVVHNVHVREPYHPDSPVHPTHEPVLTAIPRLHALVTLTERQRDDIAGRFESADNIHVVPNPIDFLVADAGEKPREKKSFVMLGRLMPQKRFEHGIAAFAQVLRREPDATLDIYGEGQEHEALQTLIEAEGLTGKVRLMGYHADAKDRLTTATALLLTSRFEGYPLVVLEALSRGCPVVAYDIAYGPGDQITDGVSGFLVEPGDLKGLADRVVQLIRDPALATRMGAAALKRAADHSAEKYLSDWQSVLRAVSES